MPPPTFLQVAATILLPVGLGLARFPRKESLPRWSGVSVALKILSSILFIAAAVVASTESTNWSIAYVALGTRNAEAKS